MINRFGEKLRTLRNYHQLTLAQLAERLGYTTHSYLSEIEAGKKQPTAQLALKIALLFDCTTDELLRDDRELNLNKPETAK